MVPLTPLVDERYMTFFNQPRTPCGGVELCAAPDEASGFTLALDWLPASIERVVFVVSTSGTETMSAIVARYLRLIDNQDERELVRFEFAGAYFLAIHGYRQGQKIKK